MLGAQEITSVLIRKFLGTSYLGFVLCAYGYDHNISNLILFKISYNCMWKPGEEKNK